MNEVRIDLGLCNGCRICIKSCFVDALRWDGAIEKPRVAYEEDCVACNACEAWCPQKCISVVPDLAAEWARFPQPY